MCVFGVYVVYKDADTYAWTQPHKVLTQNKRCKKGNYLEAFIKWRQQFTPLVLSGDGVMGEGRLLNNWWMPCPEIGTGNTWQYVGIYMIASP